MLYLSINDLQIYDMLYRDGKLTSAQIPLLAATGGSLVTRTTSKLAFRKAGRSMITQDLVAEIGRAFLEVFGEEACYGPGKERFEP